MVENMFSKNLVALRKEKGLSQKMVAADLNISQALLSHYEKGIRECGLSFVIKCADYFEVSCDYLLGYTPQKSSEPLTFKGSNKGELSIYSSIKIIFDIFKKTNNKLLTAQVVNFLSASVYTIIRVAVKNGKEVFSVDERLCLATAESKRSLSAAKIQLIIEDQGLELAEINDFLQGQAIKDIVRNTEGDN